MAQVFGTKEEAGATLAGELSGCTSVHKIPHGITHVDDDVDCQLLTQFLFYLGVISIDAQGYQLALHSEITAGRAQGIIWGVENQTGLATTRQIPSLLYCSPDPPISLAS